MVSGSERQGGPGDPFALLLEVQDLDTAIAQLHHRRQHLVERQQLEALENRRRQLVASEQAASGRLEELAQRQTALEDQIDAANARQSVVEQRMYQAGTPARELEAMEGELTHLAQRRRDLEDQELEIMEAQEPLEHEVVPLRANLSEAEHRASTVRASLAAAEAAIDQELATVTQRRQARATGLPPALAQRYERLREHLGGVGAARLVHNRCDGCHLTLPAMEIERISRLGPDEVATCEQCGRILVRQPS